MLRFMRSSIRTGRKIRPKVAPVVRLISSRTLQSIFLCVSEVDWFTGLDCSADMSLADRSSSRNSHQNMGPEPSGIFA